MEFNHTNEGAEAEFEEREALSRELADEDAAHADLDQVGDDMSEFDDDQHPGPDDDDEPRGSHDLSDDAEWLASAGMGTDEDYGYFGGNEDF